MKNKKICLFLLGFVLVINPLVLLAEEDATLDELNEQMQQADEEYKNQSEIAEVQEEINANKKKISDYNKQIKETQDEIDDLQAKLPSYEKQAGNSLKVGQKLYNSNTGLNLFASMFEEGNLIAYMSNKETISKLAQAIEDQTLILFKKIDELKTKKLNLEKNIESMEELEEELTEQLDILESEEKKSIVSKTRQTTIDFYNDSCIEGEVYGIDCGDKLEDVDEFKRPIKEGYVTNEFGGWDALNQDDGHTGIDIAQDEGMKGYKEVYPTASGQVVDVFSDSYGGIQVMMIHVMNGENYITNYAHLASVDVMPGDILTTEDKLGTMGETGVATGIHLHFEVIKGVYYIHSELENPRNYVTFPLLYLTFTEEEN